MGKLKRFAPPGGQAGSGRDGLQGRYPETIAQHRRPRQKAFLITEPGRDLRQVTVTAQEAWLLDRFIAAGRSGLTAADLPAGMRLAAVVHRPRRAGVPITTTSEQNTGPFGGSHARYLLAADVEAVP